MKRFLPLSILILFILSGVGASVFAQESERDSVKVGVYITSIHDIDFKKKEFTISFWLWLKYKNKDFDFHENLEIPNAKSVQREFYTIDTSGERVSMLMKMQCIMKDSWRITNFPFDEQKLRLSIENSQFDSRYLVFVPDTAGGHYDKRFTLRGWNIDSCVITSGNKVYETAFGDESLSQQKVEYSAFRVRLSITRSAAGLFWKMFLGMYISFLISFMCFFIHADGMDSRFGLSVGSIFAVIGNKYIIESSLPETASFTLVDMLHGVTLVFILLMIAANAYSLRLVKRDQVKKAIRFDNVSALVMMILYLFLNALFIWQSYSAA